MKRLSEEKLDKMSEFIIGYIEEHNGISPKFGEILEHMEMSNSVAYRYLMALRDRGVIEYSGKDTLSIPGQDTMRMDFCRVPVLGGIPCGHPDEHTQLVEGYVASKISIELDGKVAFATHSKQEREALGVLEEHFETAIDVVREIEGVEVAFIVKETDKGQIKASLRSVGADVASVAKKFGGGGHVRAAGCTPNAASVEEAAEMILSELQKTL